MTASIERIYFVVPYKEKEYVKSLGCKWDIQRKKWYINNENNNTKIMRFHYRVLNDIQQPVLPI